MGRLVLREAALVRLLEAAHAAGHLAKLARSCGLSDTDLN